MAALRMLPPEISKRRPSSAKSTSSASSAMRRKHLLPQRGARVGVGLLEADAEGQAPLERRVDGVLEVGGEDGDAAERLHALQEEVHLQVGVAIDRRLDLGALGEQRVGLVEQHDRVRALAPRRRRAPGSSPSRRSTSTRRATDRRGTAPCRARARCTPAHMVLPVPGGPENSAEMPLRHAVLGAEAPLVVDALGVLRVADHLDQRVVAVDGDDQILPAVGLVDAHRQRLQVVLQLVARRLHRFGARHHRRSPPMRVARRRRRQRGARRRLDARGVERQLAADLDPVDVAVVDWRRGGARRSAARWPRAAPARETARARAPPGPPRPAPRSAPRCRRRRAAARRRKRLQLGRHLERRRRLHLARLVCRAAARAPPDRAASGSRRSDRGRARRRRAAPRAAPRPDARAAARGRCAVRPEQHGAAIGDEQLAARARRTAPRPRTSCRRRAAPASRRARAGLRRAPPTRCANRSALRLLGQPRLRQHARGNTRSSHAGADESRLPEQPQPEAAIDLDAQRLQRHVARVERVLDGDERVAAAACRRAERASRRRPPRRARASSARRWCPPAATGRPSRPAGRGRSSGTADRTRPRPRPSAPRARRAEGRTSTRGAAAAARRPRPAPA